MERLYWNNDWKFAETWEEAMKEAVYPENEMEDVRLEMSSYGKGDIREPFVEAILYDGAKTLDFRYEDAVITGKKDALDGFPGSYGSVGEVQQAETVLIPAFCAIFRRSGEAMTQMPVAGRTYRQITVTGIRSRR